MKRFSHEVKIRVRFRRAGNTDEVLISAPPARLLMTTLMANGRCSPRVRQMPRGIEFGKFQLGNMVVGDIECGSDVNDYAGGATAYAATACSLRDGHH